jgi:trimeric autotransporter adhesin
LVCCYPEDKNDLYHFLTISPALPAQFVTFDNTFKVLFKTTVMKSYLFLFVCALFLDITCSYSQSVGINFNAAAPNSSAALDIDVSALIGAKKGLLIPRVTLAQRTGMNPLLLAAQGLLVYQTDNVQGFYYNTSVTTTPNWIFVAPSGSDWSLAGNAGTVDGTNFLGTTDAVAFNIKVNNQKAGRIDGPGFGGGNAFYGYMAGNANTGGYRNIALGYNALLSNTGGYANIAIGGWCIQQNTLGNGNVAIGENAYNFNIAGSWGVAIGYNAMLFTNNTSTPYSNLNVAVGYDALMGSGSAASNTGNYNTALGAQTLQANTAGGYNVAVGAQAMYTNTIGSSNSALGQYSMYNNISGAANTALGNAAMSANISGSNNTAMGVNALELNTTGGSNTAIGLDAIYSSIAGSNATAVGYQSMLYSNNTVSAFTNRNVALGYQSLMGSATAANNTGNSNTALGYQTLLVNTTGSSNVAVGADALSSNTTGASNTATGQYSLHYNDAGSTNTATGNAALQSNTSGSLNTATGAVSLGSNTVGSNNTALGMDALYYNVAGSNATAVGFQAMLYANNTSTPFTNFNTALGYQALMGSTTASFNTGNYNTALGYTVLSKNTTGATNTGVGHQALVNTSTGTDNTGVGVNAIFANTTGSQNTALGDVAYFTTANLNNTTAIGYNSGGVVNASNRIEIGDNSITFIGGQVAWGTYSDGRIKDNVKENVPGLSFITKLRPVTYNLNIHRQNEMTYKGKKKDGSDYPEKYDIEKTTMTGFIAQEVEKAANVSGYDFSGVQVPKNPNELYSLRYSDFVVPLVKAVQELSQKNDQQQKEIDELSQRIKKLEELLLKQASVR